MRIGYETGYRALAVVRGLMLGGLATCGILPQRRGGGDIARLGGKLPGSPGVSSPALRGRVRECR